MSMPRKPKLFLKLVDLVITRLALQNAASKAMLACEIALTFFFALVVLSFLAYDFVTIFVPPRSRLAPEAVIIASIVFGISLLAVYGREKLNRLDSKASSGRRPVPVFALTIVVILATIGAYIFSIQRGHQHIVPHPATESHYERNEKKERVIVFVHGIF